MGGERNGRLDQRGGYGYVPEEGEHIEALAWEGDPTVRKLFDHRSTAGFADLHPIGRIRLVSFSKTRPGARSR